MSNLKGKIAQVIGPVVDVEFNAGTALPKIYDSLEIKKAEDTTDAAEQNTVSPQQIISA